MSDTLGGPFYCVAIAAGAVVLVILKRWRDDQRR